MRTVDPALRQRLRLLAVWVVAAISAWAIRSSGVPDDWRGRMIVCLVVGTGVQFAILTLVRAERSLARAEAAVAAGTLAAALVTPMLTSVIPRTIPSMTLILALIGVLALSRVDEARTREPS